MPGHAKCCTCQQTWISNAPKCSPCQEISALTSEHLWSTCLLYYACHVKCIFPNPLQMSHACHRFWKYYTTLTFCSLLVRFRTPCPCHTKPHLNLQKWSEHVVLLKFWLGNVLRATTACTFPTSQLPKVLRTLCALRIFNFKMCFVPQRRALFRHHNFVKFLRSSGALHILTWKCALRHKGMHFFNITTSKSALRMVLCTFWLPNVLRTTTACNFSFRI